MFAHEKLQLYAKALDFCANAAELSAGWDKKHAVVDQFRRAAESIPLNLAEAVRQHAAPGRLTIIDYAIGSSLECAAWKNVSRSWTSRFSKTPCPTLCLPLCRSCADIVLSELDFDEDLNAG